jgi:hypothetical protein
MEKSDECKNRDGIKMRLIMNREQGESWRMVEDKKF